MLVQAIGQSWVKLDTERLALGLYDGSTGAPESCRGTAFGALLTSLIQQKECPWKSARRSRCTTSRESRRNRSSCSAWASGTSLTRASRSTPAWARAAVAGKEPKPLAVVMPAVDDPTPIAEALIAGLVVGTRGCDLARRSPRVPFSELTLVTEPGVNGADETVREGVVIGETVNLARDLVNTPPAEKTPTVLANRARVEAAAVGVGVEVWDEARIRAERFGGLIGVASGSDERPAFVVARLPRRRRMRRHSHSSAKGSLSTPADSRSRRRRRWKT